jgi:dTDP-4-amino-4,6-dideoxygalactose transaminase
LIHNASGQRVTAIVPVHLYGQSADMDPISLLSEKYNLKVIEDACQAHGAEYYSQQAEGWQRCGSMGIAGAFSFYPGKNLGALGEGGAVSTNDEEVYRTIKMLRDHGQERKYIHKIEGYNGRLDAIQCAFLRIKLRHLEAWNSRRRELALQYNQEFAHHCPQVLTPTIQPWAKSVFHLYVVRVKNRAGLMQELANQGIACGLHYPVPLHLQEAYQHLGLAKGNFPSTETLAEEILSLPMHPHLADSDIQRVVHAIRAFYDSQS